MENKNNYEKDKYPFLIYGIKYFRKYLCDLQIEIMETIVSELP